MFKFKRTYIDVFGIILIIFVVYYTYKAFEERHYLSDNVEYTVAKTTKFSGTGGTKRNVNYIFYVNGQKYERAYKRDYKNKSPLNRFYIVKYSVEKPTISKIDLTQEITDTLKIRQAGFKNFGKKRIIHLTNIKK